MNLYLLNLVVLVNVLVAGAHSQYRQSRGKQTSSSPPHSDDDRGGTIDEEIREIHDEAASQNFSNFRNQFLAVYVLAVAADWLQGSFLYSLYKNTHELPESVIAALFATGFLSGAVSASFVGSLADRWGRKKACLLYCLLYSLSCLTVLSSNIPLLFFGRALGGVSTTLLFSVFETWMIAEYHRLGFDDSHGGSLSSVFGVMSMVNGFVAVACGVVAEVLVSQLGSEKAPFMASVVCLGLAAQLISRKWIENYGQAEAVTSKLTSTSWKTSLGTLADPKMLAIFTTTCFMEGSMYIMIYAWPQTITSARELATITDRPPFGLIFANFMCALTLGSLGYIYLTRNGNSIGLSSHAIQVVLAVSASSLLFTILSSRESLRFWAFCSFEFCLGLYFPSMGYLKSNLVSDEHRGKVYGFIRLPLNMFVVLALNTIEQGDASRENSFMICSALLLACTFLMARYV